MPPLSLSAWLRLDIVNRILDHHRPLQTVLEVGAGVGGMAARLAARFEYVGVEPDRSSYEVAADRLRRLGRGRVVHGTLADVPGDPFDALCAFEVLEHIEDDAGALRDWRSRLRAGGLLVLSVPAHQGRYGPTDERVGHYRRYDRADLVQRITGAGFTEPVVYSYGFPMGYAIEFVRDRVAQRQQAPSSMEERSGESGRWFQPSSRVAWATAAATAPFRLLQKPFARTDVGVGFVAGARAT